MGRNIIFIIIVIIVSLSDGNAQEKFKNGFIITLKSDTVYGKIGYKYDPHKPEICFFKNNEVITGYSPSQLNGFGFSPSGFYSSAILENSFVEMLTDGKLRLFKHDGLYIQKSGDIPYKLEKKENEVVIDGSKYISEDNRWRGIILTLISDSDIDKNGIQSMSFDEDEIVKIVAEYNQRMGSEMKVYYEYKEKIRAEIGLIAGVTQSSLHLKKIDPANSILDDKYGSTDFSFGFFSDITLPGLSKKLSLKVEMDYFNVHFLASSGTTEPPSTKIYYDTDIKFSTLSMPLGLRFTVFAKKWPTYILGGMVFNYNFNTSANLDRERVANGIVTTDEESFACVDNFQVGFWSGVEVERKFEKFKIGASLKYNHVSDINDFTGFSSDINRLSFSLLLIK
jgi:hypothetical protein